MLQPQAILLVLVLAGLFQASEETAVPPTTEVIASAARQYRMQLYHSFRSQRAEYERRRAAWDQVVAAWQAAGSRADQRRLLLHWLQTALERSTPETLGPLPAIPDFGLPKAVAPPRTASRAVGPEPSLEPASTEVSPPREVAPVDVQQRPPAEMSPPAVPAPDAPAIPRRRPDSPALIAAQNTSEPPPAEIPRPPTNRLGPGSDLPDVEPTDLAAAAVPRTQSAAAPKPAQSDRIELTAEPSATDRPTLPAGEPAAVVAAPTQPVLPQRTESEVSGTPRPSANPAPLGRSAPRVASLPPKVPSLPPQVMSMPPVEHAQVNRTELAAKILGGNLGLRTCEAELDAKQTWTSRELSPIVSRLKLLVIQQHDCQLLQALLSEPEQALVGSFESPQPVFRALRTRILEARRYALSGAFPGTEAERTVELHALDTLARSLNDLIAARW